jgi:hypothetical protein
MRPKAIYALFLAGAGLIGAEAVGPSTFGTPEQAREALVQNAARGLDALREMMGPGSAEILRSGDPIQDKILLEKFRQRVAQKAQLEPDQMNANRITLLIGDEEWPFAVPLMRKNGRWYFDIQEGKAEIRRRIIGGNELDAIEVCRGFVEAEETYARTDWTGKGVLQYASKIASTPGKKDGLYWPGDDSPIAERIAKAMAQGYSAPGGASQGYHGYVYKVLLSQGPDAEDGEEDYVAHGLMIGGFALVARPVEYGVSGIMTFIVNQDGVVYQKDLGRETAALVKTMTKFNPDKSWNIPPD